MDDANERKTERRARGPLLKDPLPLWLLCHDGDDTVDLVRTADGVPGIERIDAAAEGWKGAAWAVVRPLVDMALEHGGAGWSMWRLAGVLHLRGLIACADPRDPVAPVGRGAGNRIEDLAYASCVRALQARRAEAVVRAVQGLAADTNAGPDAYLEAARFYDHIPWQDRHGDYVDMHEDRRRALGRDYDEEADKACMVLESEMDSIGLLNETDSQGHYMVLALRCPVRPGEQGRP